MIKIVLSNDQGDPVICEIRRDVIDEDGDEIEEIVQMEIARRLYDFGRKIADICEISHPMLAVLLIVAYSKLELLQPLSELEEEDILGRVYQFQEWVAERNKEWDEQE